MGLESTPTKISDLNELWPLSTDDPKYGDDHLRNIKAVLKALDTATAELRGRLVSVQKFTADGTWTRPTGVRYILVESKGGGGGGGGGSSNSNTTHGGGGGEGGYCKEFIDVTAISSVTVTVGSGGAGGAVGANGSNGSDGEDTTFGAHHTAGGGKGGHAGSLTAGATSSSGGAGGTASGGDVNLPGCCGLPADRYIVPMFAGAGGGSGGAKPISNDDFNSGDGYAGTANSGGGGGGGWYAPSHGTGGAGGSGCVVVWEYT